MAEGKISFDEFKKIDLRVAEILEAEDIEGADKLFKLKITLGSEERTIVAGLKQNYKKEDLIGKQIIIVANLEPATLKGVESNGMLLAAVSDLGKANSRGNAFPNSPSPKQKSEGLGDDRKKIVLLKPEKKISAGTKIS